MYHNDIKAMNDPVIAIPSTVVTVIVSSNRRSCGIAVALGLMASTAIVKYTELMHFLAKF